MSSGSMCKILCWHYVLMDMKVKGQIVALKKCPKPDLAMSTKQRDSKWQISRI